MGASVYVRWPGLGSEEPIDHPGFDNDDTGYARWIEAVISSESIAAELRSRGFESLLHVYPADYPDRKIIWVDASRLKREAEELASEVEGQSELGNRVSASYKVGPSESKTELLAQELRNVASIAEFAIDEGAKEIALTIGW